MSSPRSRISWREFGTALALGGLVGLVIWLVLEIAGTLLQTGIAGLTPYAEFLSIAGGILVFIGLLSKPLRRLLL